MDWLTFKFCVLIWVLCISTAKSQIQLFNSTSILSNQLRSDCKDGQPVVPPDRCNSCICFAGQEYCTNMPCPEQDCVNGVELPQPDECNKCICRRGKVTCSNLICIPAPNCAEKQLYPAQNKCNVCMCLNGFITCTNNPCGEDPLPSTIPTTTTKKPKKKKKCIEGDSLPGPNECIECFCQDGRKRCKFVCPTMESRFGEGPECVSGQHIPRPDDCNNCICFEGQIHCTHLPCRMDTRIGPDCTDDQPVYKPDECNECYCFEGRLECSDLVCIRGSKCVEGQVIPKPDSCNACKCVEGHILCTDYQCPIPNSRNALRPARASKEVKTLDECQEGDVISPPPPPNDCNICYCMNNRITCTINNCEGSNPEIKGRLREPNEQTDLEMFDKKVSVEPFIDMLSKNHEKLPAKLIHTHAYNGFHQEIKVHASHLPKDATKLLKVLATSLDNSALASISQRLLTSSNSLSNNDDSKIPLNQSNLGDENLLTTQTSKLVTSGSQSNETILVIPSIDDGQYSQSILPLTNKHESIWKSISSPASLVFHNNQQINPRNSQEENLNVYNDNPPLIPIDKSNVIRNPSKFSRPGLPHMLSIKPTRNTVEKPNTNSQPIYPASNLMNVNDGKINYETLFQENKPFKPVLSGFASKHDELPHLRPYQLTLPSNTLSSQVFNYTLSNPVFRPGKFIVTPNNNDGQQKPSQSLFIPNLSKFYASQAKPQQIQFQPNKNNLPSLNNMGIQPPPLLPNNLIQPILVVNQYKQPQFGLKPGQGSVSPLSYNGNQTDQQFKAFSPSYQINPAFINLPNQKKRISSMNDGSKEMPVHSIIPNSTDHHTKILNIPQIGVDPENRQHKPSHSQLVPNPSIYYRHEYEAPKIIEVNPDSEELIPHSNISHSHTEHYNPPTTSSELDHDTPIPKVRNKTRKYNTTHSRYEKHTMITYVSEYDPTHPANPHKIVHDLNQHQNAPQTNVYEYDLPNQESQELDLTMSKVNYYLNLPNLQLDQYVEPYPNPNHQFHTFPESPSNGENADQFKSSRNRTYPTIPMYPNIFANYPHNNSQSQFIPSQDNSKKGGLNDPISAEGIQSRSNSDEGPTYPKSNEHPPSPSQTGTNQNQHPPGVFDDRGSDNGFQYEHNVYKHPRQLKPVHKLLPSKLETPQDHQLPGFLDERGSASGFQYPSNSAGALTHPKVALSKSPHFDPYISIGNPEQPKDNPYISPHSGEKGGFQYLHNADGNPTLLKPLQKLLPFTHPQTPFGSTLMQHSPDMFDEHASADGFQYPSNSAETPIHSRGNLNHPKLIQYGPTQNQHLPGMFDVRGSSDSFHKQSNSLVDLAHNHHLPGIFDDPGSADGFQYPSNLAENPTHPKQNNHIQSKSPVDPAQNQHLPGIFDERGSADGFQYPSNSAENPRHPKQNNQIQPKSSIDPTHNQYLPGMFDDRGFANGFQYPSNSAENPTHPKDNLNKLPQSQFLPSPYQHIPGMFDDRGSANGFQYPSNSAEKPRHPKQNNQIQSKSPIDHTHNQHIPGIFDDRVSANGFQYPSYSAENPRHPKQNNHIQSKSPVDPAPNQHLPGMFDDRGSTNGFQYPSNSAENPTHPKQNNHIQSKSPVDPTHNQHLPGIFDERGSADGFQYPSNSAENPRYPKQNNHIQSKFPVDPTHNQHLPGIFDDRGSANGFQYTYNSAENPKHPKNNLNKLPQSQFLPSPNQHTPGMFEDRGSANGFQYPSNSAENPRHPKQNDHIQSKSPVDPAHNQHLPGIFDDRGSANGFQYPSNSAENPRHPKQNNQIQPKSPIDPTQNQHLPGIFDEGGSADGFQYPSNSAEKPRHPKQINHIQSKSPVDPAQDQHIPGELGDRGSGNGFQYPPNSAENPRHPIQNNHIQSKFSVDPTQNQHIPGILDERGSADGFQYPSNSAENPRLPKQNNQIQPKSPVDPTQNQHLPGIFDERGSADGFQYPSNSAENPRHPKQNNHIQSKSPVDPAHNQHIPGEFGDRGSGCGFHYPSMSAEDSTHPKDKPPHSSLGHNQSQHLPGMFDEHGSINGFQYPSNSTENHAHTNYNHNTTPKSMFKLPENKPKLSSLGDGYNNNNPLRPGMNLEHDQYKPSSFDNLLNGVHYIPWSFSGDKNKDLNTVTHALNTWFKPDHDQYKPSSFDNLLNGIHQTPWSVPNQDNNALGLYAEITTPRSGFKPKQDQYGPSMVNDPSIYNGNENTDLTDVDNNQLQIEQDVSTPYTDLTDSFSSQYDLLPELKPDSDPDSLFPTNDGKIPDYYDQLYPLLQAVKKLSDPPIDDSVYSVGSMDQLNLLPYLFSNIAKILNYNPSQDQNDVSPVENNDAQRINPFSKLNSKLIGLPENGNGILNWLKSKLNKLVPTKDNTTVTKNDIDITKIFNLLSKLTPPKLKHNAALHDPPFSGFDPEIIEKIMNDFEDDTLTTTSTPRTESTQNYEKRFWSDPTLSEESEPQTPQLKYPDVHIILHQPGDADETDGEINLPTDMDSEELSASMFPKMFNPRFRHRPKDQKEECGDGTQWISNCHGCSCYFGEAMCYRLPDCELRPLGEPMTCKPYSHFKMGCYTCECNGDGVAECDATDCSTQPSGESKGSGTTERPLSIFNEFFDSKKTKEILQYYNFSKKLPKDCPKEGLETQYPTCERGTSWISSCHKCECNDNGKHECIKIDNCKLDVDSYGKPARCKPNSKFYPKMNSMPCVECSCNDEGISYCPTVDYKKH